MFTKFDLYCASKINRGNRILIAFWLCSIYRSLYSCSKQKLSTKLIALRTLHVFSCYHFDSKHYVSFLVCIISISCLFYDWITVIGYSKHEPATINMFLHVLLPKKSPLPSHNGHFFSVPKVAVLYMCGVNVRTFPNKRRTYLNQ